jgi:hypothetical protein
MYLEVGLKLGDKGINWFICLGVKKDVIDIDNDIMANEKARVKRRLLEATHDMVL